MTQTHFCLFPQRLLMVALLSLAAACSGGDNKKTPPQSLDNVIPIAAAGPDQNVSTGTKVTLNGGDSMDADGDPLTYRWSMISAPEASAAELSDAGTVTPDFTPDLDGAYHIQLIVNDGKDDSEPDVVIVTASTGNSVPVANAGPDQEAKTGLLVELDGTASSDADGDELSYSWVWVSRPLGSNATLDNADSPAPYFTPDVDGEYVASLTVNDGTEDSAPDTVTITATSEQNARPVANAGPDQEAKTGMLVELDGTASSDADGDELSYSWVWVSRPLGSNATLDNADSPAPYFTPDVDGEYVASLTVNDGTEDSAPDTVTITATSEQNARPVANAGPDQAVKTGDKVTLDGSASSDADGDELGYSWNLVSRPVGSTAALNDSSSVAPEFTPDRDGQYVVSLTVNDGTDSSTPDTVTITATSQQNARPVANAGPDQAVKTGDKVTLDGSASSDADGDELGYSWNLVSRPVGSAAALNDSSSVAPEFTPDRDGQYVVSLTVNDGTDSSTPDTVTITATSQQNARPVANAGPDQAVKTGDRVTLDGRASSDADGDLITYRWSWVSRPPGSAAALDDPTFVTPSFTADVEGQYVVSLTVSDGTDDSVPDTVSISATTVPNSRPTANAGPDQTVRIGTLVHLDGTASNDADGDLITYAWSIVSKPVGSTAFLSDSTAAAPSFTADLSGNYVVSLTVHDGKDASTPDSVRIDAVANSRPVAEAGPDQNVKTGSVVTLDGSASRDANGDALEYLWTWVSRPPNSSAEFSDPSAVNPSFTADVDGQYLVQLVVRDDSGTSSSESIPDSVRIAATTQMNSQPVANAGPDQIVKTGTVATLDGSGSSDADGQTLSYEWAFVSKPFNSSAVLNNATSATPDFRPDLDGDYVVRLIVTDSSGALSAQSLPDTVRVTATPTGTP